MKLIKTYIAEDVNYKKHLKKLNLKEDALDYLNKIELKKLDAEAKKIIKAVIEKMETQNETK